MLASASVFCEFCVQSSNGFLHISRSIFVCYKLVYVMIYIPTIEIAADKD